MATPLQDASGSGFYGKGYWGRKVFWLNVPSQWRNLDQFDYLQMLLNTWGDVGESFIEQIYMLPYQRDPYTVRTRSTWTRWFYVTESFTYTDDDKGDVTRLVGEKNSELFPAANLSSPPSSDETVMSEQFPWYPYEPLEDVGRWWQLYFRDAQYEVANVRARNYDQASIYNSSTSLANEVWVSGGDLTLLFDYFTDRLWDTSVDDSSLRGTVKIGETDGSQRPAVELPVTPVRLVSRWSDLVPPSMLTEAATVIIRVPLEGGGYRFLYDVPTSENEGTLNSESGGTITATTAGTINYLSGYITIDLSNLSEFSSQTISDIKIRYDVRGYFLKFNAPPTIDYFAKDFGFDNDQNDPEDVQRSSIANVTKFWGIKSTADSYRVRGEISLFDVDMQGLYAICSDELASQIPIDNVFTIGGSKFTDVSPVYVRVDHIASDEFFYDADDPAPPGTPAWITMVDNMLIAEDPARWDGMTIGQAYAVDVTQGYWGQISPVISNVRGPAVVTGVTTLSQEDLEARAWQNGYTYEIEMKRCQYEAFNMIVDSEGNQNPALFALSVYDYNATPSLGTPPAVDDLFYYIDYQDSEWSIIGSQYSFDYDNELGGPFTVGEALSWTGGTGYLVELTDAGVTGSMVIVVDGGVAPSDGLTITGGASSATCDVDGAVTQRDDKEDVGTWTVSIQFGLGVASPISVSDDVAVRYMPDAIAMSCCYCRSYKMRAVVDVTDEAYEFYDTYQKVENAISRLKLKLTDPRHGLLPVHARIIEWEISRKFTDEMFGVQNGATVEHSLGGDQFVGNTQVLLTVQYRGDSDSGTANTDLDFRVYSEDTGTVWDELSWNPTTPAGDNETWVDVVVDEEITLPSGTTVYDVLPRAIAGSASAYGDVRWIFVVTRIEE